MGSTIEGLKELSFELKEGRATVGEALDGIRLRNSLKERGIEDPEELESILLAASKINKDPTIKISDLIGCAGRMLDLEMTEGMPYSELGIAYNVLVSNTILLKNRLHGLEGDFRAAEDRKKDSLEREKTTEIQLKEYIRARDYLREMGYDIEDLPKLRNMLVNAADSDFEPRKILDCISKHESLINEINELDEKIPKKRELNTELDIKIKAARGELEVLQAAFSNLSAKIKKSEEFVEEFEKTTNSIKDLAEASVRDAKNQIKGVTDSVSSELKAVNLVLSEAKPAIQDFSKVIREADEVAAVIAKEGTVLPLLQMIKEGKGSEIEVLTSMLLVLSGFDKWLRAKEPRLPKRF